MKKDVKNEFKKNVVYEKNSVEKLIEKVKYGVLDSDEKISDDDFWGAVRWYCKNIIKYEKEIKELEQIKKEIKK